MLKRTGGHRRATGGSYSSPRRPANRKGLASGKAMNDIRSFFKSAGSGGSTKAKSGGKTNGGGDSRKSSASKKTDVKTPGGKKSGAGASSRGSSKPSPKGNAGNGTTTSTTDSKSNATNKKPSKLVKHGAADDDDDDEVEDVTPISTKEARKDTGSRKGASASSAGGDVRAKKKNNDESSTGDNRVEVVASPSKKSQASSPGARKRKAVEVATEGEVESPSRGESRGARSRRQKGEGTTTVAKKTSSPATPAGTRKGRKAHRRIEEDDEDIEGDGGDDDNGDDDDEYDNNDDDDDNFDPDEDEDEDDDDEEDEGDDDDSDDDDDDYRGGSRSRKRKSSSNAKGVSSSKLKRINRGDKKAASRTTSSSVSRDGKKQLQRVEHTKAGDAMDDDDYADGEDDETRTMRPKTSKPFASASSAARGKSSPSKKEVVDLGGTSSDEKDEEDKEAPAPAPRKKASAPSRSGATAAKESPSGENAKKTGRGGGGGGFRPWMGGARKAPPNEGKKEVPVGADQCLAGMTFVVSGVLDSLGREAAEDLIKQYGGKVTGSVSSKTTFLLLGSELDDGRAPQEGSKYRNAMKRKTKIIDENELFKMLRDSNKGAPPKASAGSTPTAKDAAGAATGKPAVTNPYAKMAVANPYKSFASKKASGSSASAAASSTRNGQGSGSPSVVTVSNEPGRMWVDKYKPQTTADVIGHGAQVKKLRTWLQNWEAWHLKSNGPTPPKGSDNPGARAALLSGAPGVGKSSTATLVAKELGYHVMELNASDTRNKRSLSEELDTVVGNQVLGFTAARSGGSASKPKKGGESGGFRKQLVIMDEVDGMGGSDRGGIQELISLIKKTKVPIIAICNDRQHQKIRSLVNHCYDLRFSRPQKATIAKRVRAVAKMEGLEVDDNAAEMLVEANGNDIRQVLHALEMWSRKSSKLSYMNLKEGLSTIEKDKILRCGPFEAARSILGGGKTPLRDRYEAFFTDYSLLPLLVQQNYLSSLMTVDAKTRVEVTAGAAAAMSDMDIVGGKIRGDVQHWELLPTQAALTVRVGSIGSGSLGYPEFPKWLGMFSRENKRRRLLGELATHLNAAVSGGPEAVRLSYLYYLKTFLTLPLRERGVDGAQECVDMLEEYGLSRDDLFEVIPEFLLSWKGMKNPPADVFAGLDSKCKSAVTRCYNSIAHKSQALVDTMQAPKAKKTKAPPKSLAMEEGDDSEEDVEEEDGEDDVSAFKTKGKPRGSTGGKNSTPKSRGKAASSGGGRGRK